MQSCFWRCSRSLGNLQISVVLLSIGRVGLLVAVALTISRFVLPRLFHQIARRPELILLGALAWCFLIGEIAERLHLSREMGSLVAGVSLSTFPYALDVTAKVTTLRDFFITLFFVALGMTIPDPRSFGDRPRAGDRSLHGRQPAAHDLRAALSDEAGSARQPAAGDQSGPDQRVFAGGDSDRDRQRAYQDRNRQCGVVRIRDSGGAEHLCDDAQRPDHAGCHWPAEADRDSRSGSRPRHRRGTRGGTWRDPADRDPGIFPRGQRIADRDRAKESIVARPDQRGRFQSQRVSNAGRSRLARDLRRYQQCRHLGACRGGNGADRHTERARLRC